MKKLRERIISCSKSGMREECRLKKGGREGKAELLVSVWEGKIELLVGVSFH